MNIIHVSAKIQTLILFEAAMAMAAVAAVALMAGAAGAPLARRRLFSMARFVPRPRLERWLALVSVLAILGQEIARTSAIAPVAGLTEFDGFGDEFDEGELDGDAPIVVPPPVVRRPGFETDRGPPVQLMNDVSDEEEVSAPVFVTEEQKTRPRQDLWDEDEFEGLPEEGLPEGPVVTPEKATSTNTTSRRSLPTGPQNYYMEAFSIVFLAIYAVQYYLGRKENEKIALAWASEYASKGSIFDKNFSLLGTGEGEDAALLMKEGQTVFKFYASGRRYCQGLLATLDLRNRHDLISCLWDYIIPKRDELNIDVLMNDENMDTVMMAVARRKNAKSMNKDWKDLQQFATLITPPSQRKWVSEELSVISESREVASDLLSDGVLDLVFGDKAFEKYGSNFISLHFSDAYPLGVHKKTLQFRFYLPPANRMGDIARLIQMVLYFIDTVGRYKLSAQARAKADAARQKVAQEAFKEAQSARQELLARKKEEKRKAVEELPPEVLRRKEEKERARQLKKSMPKMRMTRAH